MNSLNTQYVNPNYSPVIPPDSFQAMAGYGNPNYSPVPKTPIGANPNTTHIPVVQPTVGSESLWGNIDWDSALGAAPAAIQGLSSIANAYLGMQQYNLAKDQFAQNKKEFEMNYNANKKMTNSRLEDRQRARVASNPTAYRSVGEYMDKYGVK